MTTTTAHKCLDEIETFLTPKEWAIRLADEERKYPDTVARMKVLAKLPLHELPTQRPFYAFEKQASHRHPGLKPDDIRARNRVTDALWKEFHTLKLLIRQVNLAMQSHVQSISLQAALRLSALHALILQDAFAQTATQTAALLAPQKRREKQQERQAILNLLAPFAENIREIHPDSVVAQNAFPSPLTEWRHDLNALLKDFFAHRAAVELVQGQHFDGHPILFLEVEAELAEATRAIESAVATANDYLRRRAEQHNAKSNVGAGESNPVIDLESIKASAKGDWAAAIGAKWLRETSFEAIETDAEHWERCRQEFGSGTV